MRKIKKYYLYIIFIFTLIIIFISLLFFKNLNLYDVQSELLSDEVNGNPWIGNKDAKNKIVVFSDFSCPYCKEFHDEVLPILNKKHIGNEEASLTIINVDILGENSKIFAYLGDSIYINYPEKYWDYFHLVYENQKINNKKVVREKDIIKMLKQLDISKKKIEKIIKDYKSSYTNGNYRIEKNKNVYKKYSVPYVPSVYVNGHFVEDAYSIKEIEKYLKK